MHKLGFFCTVPTRFIDLYNTSDSTFPKLSMAVLTVSYEIPGTSPDNFTLKGDEDSSDYREKKQTKKTSALVFTEVHKP